MRLLSLFRLSVPTSLVILVVASSASAQNAKSDLSSHLDRLGWSNPPAGLEASGSVGSGAKARSVTIRANTTSGSVLRDSLDGTKAIRRSQGSWLQRSGSIKQVPGHASDPLSYPEDLYFFHSLTKALAAGAEVEQLDRGLVGSEPVQRFQIRNNRNGTAVTLSISETTGLPVQAVAIRRSMSNWHVAYEVTVTYADFRPVGRAGVPHRLTRQVLGSTEEMRFSSIKEADVPDTEITAAATDRSGQ